MPRFATAMFLLAVASTAPAEPVNGERKTVVGTLAVAGCTEHQPPADCLRPGNPVVLEAANGEIFLLHGVERIDLERLQGLTTRPVVVTGPFSWLGKVRTLRLDVIRAAGNQEVETARSAEPEGLMVQYFITILRPGPAQQGIDETRRAALMVGHFGHIRRQAAAGTLRLAGPFGEQEPERWLPGISLYVTDSLAAAEALSAEDPAIAAGYFIAEILPWWGPESLAY